MRDEEMKPTQFSREMYRLYEAHKIETFCRVFDGENRRGKDALSIIGVFR